MQCHSKFDEVLVLVEAGVPVLLTGEKGSGKTTLVMQIAENLKLRFFSLPMTRQTTLSHLLGFMSVNGTYVPSLLKDAFENGGLFLLDEIDAGDPNVLLCLNTIENGYISFPSGIIKVHDDFRLLATANPQNQHEFYTGRSKLDAATLDRFDTIEVGRDESLEKSLVDFDTTLHMTLVREVLAESNSSIVISMRDSMRYQKRKELGLLDGFLYKLIDKSDLVFQMYEKRLSTMPKHSDQSECKTFPELVALMNIQAKQQSDNPSPPGNAKGKPPPTQHYNSDPEFTDSEFEGDKDYTGDHDDKDSK